MIKIKKKETSLADASGRIENYGIETTEKSPFWLDVTASGTAGHGSRPTSDNLVFLLSSRRRHTRWTGDWSSDVCSSDLWPAEADHLAELTPVLGLLAGQLV